MSKVSLSLVGVKSEVARSEVLTALSKLYGKPESHFEPHCEHLFELRTPFVHLKKVSRDEAEKHQERLESIGIQTAIGEIAGSSGLSLLPIEEKESPAEECPSCNQVTSDPEMCSKCGVIIKKFVQQQTIDNNLQRKLEAANRSHDRIGEIRSEEDKRRKEAVQRVKNADETTQSECSVELDEDRIVVKVEDSSNKKVLALASVALITSVVGSSYLFLEMRNNIEQSDQYSYAITDESADSSTAVATSAATVSSLDKETKELVETGTFNDWSEKLERVTELQNKLNILDETVGMSSTMEGLLVETTDPFVRIIGTQYLVKLRMQKSGNIQLSTLAASGQSYNEVLADNSTLIQTLPSKTEQLYAQLSLARTYTELEQPSLADSALEEATLYAIEIAKHSDASDRVIAEVISAEFFANYDASDKILGHYNRAVELSQQIEPDSDDAEWALAFIARSQASTGQYVDAYKLIDKIDNQQIAELVMEDISVHAKDQQISSADLIPDTTIATPDEFVDDPDIQLLYENHSKMQENAKKLSSFAEKLTQ